MEKSQATRLGVLAALALALLMVGSYFMSTGQGPESMVVSFPSGTQMTVEVADSPLLLYVGLAFREDRKSTRLNSSHTVISYAVFCLKKKKKIEYVDTDA